MAADTKDLLIRELKDSVSEQRQMNKTLRAALENSNNQVNAPKQGVVTQFPF